MSISSETLSEKTREDRRITHSRKQILDAAVLLYQSKGIDKTSISAVIEESKVGRATFYRHFSDRDDVLNSALVRDFETLMQDFQQIRKQYDSIEVQIEEDMIWFLDQFAQRPALSLLFSDTEWARYEQTSESLNMFRGAAIACASPTYERAQNEGRLRAGITLEKYIDWASFVVVSLHVVKLPSVHGLANAREMIRNFLMPSLISDH